KRGSMPQIQRKAKLLAYIGRGMTEGAQRLVMFLLVALHRHIDAGVAQVIRDPNFRNSHHCQSRIFEFVTNNLRNFFAQGFGDALATMHVRTACGSGRFTTDDETCNSQDQPPATAGGFGLYSSVAAIFSIM